MGDTAVFTQYLTFHLADATFAIDVKDVREVLEVVPITKVPGMPDAMCGVINVRGSVVPVIDARTKFGMAPAERTINSCIVVMESDSDRGKFSWGALVDAVEEVIELDGSQVEPPPRVGTGAGSEMLKGIGKRAGRFVMILDLMQVFRGQELDLQRVVKAMES